MDVIKYTDKFLNDFVNKVTKRAAFEIKIIVKGETAVS